MELAGLKVVMDADFSAVYAGFKQANAAAKRFQKNTADIFKGINVNPELSNGANLASQIQEAQKAAASASKAFQTNRKLEIAGTKELLAVQRQAATEANSMTAANLKYSIDAINRKNEAERKSAAEGNNITAANLKASISAINRRNEAQQRAAAAAIQAYNAENQAVIDNIRTTKNLQAAINKINAAKAREKDLYGELVAENQKLVREYYNAAAAVAKYGKSSGITTKDLEQMQAAALKGQQQLQQIEQGAGRFHRNVGNYASAFNPLTLGVSQFARELPNLAFGARTFFMSISNQFGQLQDGFAQLKRSNAELIAQGKPAKSAISSLAGAIFSWNTAISIGVTLLTVYGPKLFEMAKNGWKNVDAIKAQKEYQEALNNAVDTANGEAATQISRIRVLNDTMTNANLTMKQRKDAYKEAVKEYPGYLKQIKEEDALSGALAKTITSQLIPAILAAAKSRAYEQKIQLAQERIIDLEQKQIQNLKDRASEQRKLTQAQVKAASVSDLRAAGEQRSATALEAAERANERASNAVDLQRASVEQATKALNDNASSRIKLNEEIDNYAKGAQRALEAAGDLSKADKATAGAAEKATTALQDLINKNKQANQELSAGLITNIENVERQISNTRSYIQKLTTGKNALPMDSSQVVSANEQLKELETRLRGYQFTLDDLAPSEKSVGEAFRDAFNPETNAGKLGVQEVNVPLYVSNQNKEAQQQQYDEAVAQAQRFYQQMEKQAEAAFGSLGEMIGNAFNGQNFDIVSGIIGVLGDQLKQLGAYLIEVGLTKEAIENALKALGVPGGGAGVIIAGVAAVALGQVLKNAAQKRMQNLGGRREFAAGGVVYGPTNALVGEYRGASSNPEVIAPLDKLTNILRSEGLGNRQMQPIVLSTRIDGQDILLSQERARKWRDR